MKLIMLPLLLAALLPASKAYAANAAHIHVSQAWIRVLPGDLPAGAYATLDNSSGRPVALQGASSNAYASIELHESFSEAGINGMTTLKTLSIPAHGHAMLAPAGSHLMLMQPTGAVKPGDTVRINLRFTDGSSLPIDFMARPANALDISH